MLQPNAIASYATFSTFAACILGAGFMVRFLVALASDKKTTRHGMRRQTAEPGTHLAAGVLRIANVFALTHHVTPAATQPYLVAKGGRHSEADAAGRRAQRVG